MCEKITEEIIEQENTQENEVLQKLDALTVMFEQKIQNDEWKNKKYDEMHSLMLKYQDDIVGKMIDPVLKSLIQLSDIIDRDKRYYSAVDDVVSKEDVIDLLDGIAEQVNAILFDYDIEEYSGGTELVNAKEQKMFRTIATDNLDLNNHVAEIINKGYKKADKIIRMEKVNIYKYTEKNEEN